MAARDSGKHHPQIDETANLKICGLCGALNLVSELECIVCRWHGHFERRPEVVRIALEFYSRQRSSGDLQTSSEDLICIEDRTGGVFARLAALWDRFKMRRGRHSC